MKKYIKTALILSVMLSSTIAFAFPADPDPTSDPVAPIDDYVIGLLLAGLAIAYWKFSKKVKKA